VLEVGGGPDMRARAVGDQKRGKEREAGPQAWWAARADDGPQARGRGEREKGRRPAQACGPRKRKAGRGRKTGLKERERKG
jgi:hypothetical protein